MEGNNSENQTSNYVLEQEQIKQNSQQEQDSNINSTNNHDAVENGEISSPKKNGNLDINTDSQQLKGNSDIASSASQEDTNQTSDQNFGSQTLDFEDAKRNPNNTITQKDESLFGLINSEFFNIHMLFTYLLKASSDEVVGQLIQKLSSESVEMIDFYLPQICYTILTKQEGIFIVEKFVLETAVKYRNIGIKALQLFQSFSEDTGALYQEKAMNFYNDIEQTLVNGDIPQKYLSNLPPQKDDEEYCDKKFKADYLTHQIRFTDHLKYLSIKLKSLNVQDRPAYLKKRLEELNVWIDETVRVQIEHITTKSKYNYQGVVLPFEEGDDEDPFIIMNILPNEACPFDTKKRAPFKVTFETVRLNELILIRESKTETRQGIIQDAFEQNQETLLGVTQEDQDEADNPFFENSFKKEDTKEEQDEQASKENNLKDEKLQEIQFEENKLFVKQDSLLSEESRLKTSQSVKVQGEEMKQIISDQLEESTAKSSENKEQKKSSVDQNGKCKIDLSNPQQLKEILEKYSGNNKPSAHTNSKDYGSTQQNFEDWDILNYSDLNLEGMDDPFKDRWSHIHHRYNSISDFKDYKSYQLKPLIVKANDDLRQEILAMQLMKRLQQIFRQANLHVYLRPYQIFITSSNSGMIEFIPDTISIDSLKKKFPKKGAKPWTLKTFFERYFITNFEEAQKNFAESLAGYSLFNYLFNVKDRHNANIMLDAKGHLVHIDYGFMFQNSPGGISFEGAPFKLTQEYVDLMGGLESEIFQYYKSLMIRGFFEIRKNLDDILSLIEILMKDSKMPCFVKPKTLISEIKDRISLKYNTGEGGESDYFELVERIVKNSAGNWRTAQYDQFQKMTNGIEK